MILRRVMEHVRTQNWTAVAIDFVIVIVGVFIGIQVSNWNEARADRQTGREYVSRIQEELAITRQTFLDHLDLASWVITHTTQALDTLEHGSPEPGEAFVLDAYIAAHEIVGFIKRDVYDELLSVGALSKISNLEARERIQSFYQLEQDLFDMGVTENSYQLDLRRAMPHDVIMTLRRNCSARFSDEAAAKSRTPRFEGCDMGLTTEQLARTLADLEAADLKFSLREALGDYQNKERDFQDVLRQARELSDFLAANP